MDLARRQRLLRQHVQTDQLLGVEAVPRRPAAPHAHAHAHARPERSEGRDPLPSQPDQPQADSLLALADAPAAPANPPLPRDQRLALLQEMDEQEVKGCLKCELCQSRTQTVFGEGDPEAPVMFIGEGPGQTEDETGRPFVGRAGELLDKMINAMGYDRAQVYIANVVKCRPPGNRTPTPVEVQACWDYLRRQIDLVRPKAIVTLGGPAAKMVLQTDMGITRLRGTWHRYDGINPPIPVMPTFHPAYLLRSYTKDNRLKVWSDLQAVMTRIKAP